METAEKTVKKNYIYKGKILNLRRDDAMLPDGNPCVREIIEHSGGAAVLCVKDGKVALVRQFRYAYGEDVLEIPAGKLNEGENPKLAAMRELSEETGLVAEDLRLINVVYPTPGYTSEKIYVYEAIVVSEGKQHLDEDEFLNVEYYPVEEVLKMAQEGVIRDSKTLIAVLSVLKK